MAVTTITTPGSGTWTVPAGVTSVIAEVWGGGGGGGSGTSSNTGSGGGGGGYGRKSFSVTPGNNVNYTVGAGGTWVTSGAGNPGTESWFSTNLSAGVLANGGAAGTTTTGGSGGSASGTGAVTYTGGTGANKTGSYSGGGGSSAGSNSSGNNASGITGGSAVTDGGFGGNGINTTVNGNPGGAPGGGGGGGLEGSGRISGAGANGQLRLTYFASISGTVNKTLGTLVLSSAGNLVPGIKNIDGDLDATLGTLTLVSSGDVVQKTQITGELTQTLGLLVCASDAWLSINITGTLNKTLGTLTLVSAGNIQERPPAGYTIGWEDLNMYDNLVFGYEE